MKFAYFTFGEPAKILTHIHMKKINLEAATVPLSDGVDPGTERLPEPQWIDVSGEEYKKLMDSFDGSWPRIYMSKEDLLKHFPETIEGDYAEAYQHMHQFWKKLVNEMKADEGK